MPLPVVCWCGHFHGGTCPCGCAYYEPDAIDQLVDWQLHESPAARMQALRETRVW